MQAITLQHKKEPPYRFAAGSKVPLCSDPLQASGEILAAAANTDVTVCLEYGNGFFYHFISALINNGCLIQISEPLCFSSLRFGKARTTVAADALGSFPLFDSAIDLEITDWQSAKSKHPTIKILTDNFGADKNILYSIAGRAVSCRLNELPENADALFIFGENTHVKTRYCFSDLLRIMARLTAEDGCPWDREQTHMSITGNMIEEAYEAVSAVLENNTADMLEEFGDVLLQSVFNCDIAARSGNFTLCDCVDNLSKKLYLRHTHIFGADKAASGDDALRFWEQAKAKEKNYSSAKRRLEKLPASLPLLTRAQKVIKIIRKDKQALACETVEKITDAIREIIADGTNKESNEEKSKLILLSAALLSFCDIDAEVALTGDLNKLINNFESSPPSRTLADLIIDDTSAK